MTLQFLQKRGSFTLNLSMQSGYDIACTEQKPKSMKIKDKIQEDLKTAMKERDQTRIDTLRSVLSAFTYKKDSLRKAELTDEEELEVLVKQVKQRNDSIAEFSKAGRNELVEKEAKEKDILGQYLPAQKSKDEVRQMIKEIIAGLDAAQRNPGNVMKAAMPKLKGLADGNLVKELVAEELKS